MDKKPAILTWLLRLLAGLILLQTLYFKFTGAEESVYIFSTLHMEPWGRMGIGVLELVAAVLILYPKTTGPGALLGLGLMCGAIFSHLTQLGIVVLDDGGQLFIYALLVLIACLLLVWMHRKNLSGMFNTLFKKQ